MPTKQKLFSHFQSKTMKLPNRIVMAPMTRNFSPNNVPSNDVVSYYRRRAQGGVGLIITEGTCVNHIASNCYPNVPYMYGEESIAGWSNVVDAVHDVGGQIAAQLWHVGAVRKLGMPPNPEVNGYGPSGMNVPGKQNREIMTIEDIDQVISAFVEAAKTSKEIGFDAIELHGAHGYLLDQFFWSGTNQRNDKYAGSIEKRCEFVCEIIRLIRSELGSNFPIILRWSQWKMQNYEAKLAHSPQELETFLTPLVDSGIDIFHCSQRRFWEPEFKENDLNLAGWVKKICGKPTITVGSIGLDADFISNPSQRGFSEADPANLAELLDRLDREEFDLIAVGRALISNPDWANHVKNNEEGKITAFKKEHLGTLV
jgi:2,4-dienoyl-CoA reductase-like NADH-dependent reductase (Old Yellow Enzyme family)